LIWNHQKYLKFLKRDITIPAGDAALESLTSGNADWYEINAK